MTARAIVWDGSFGDPTLTKLNINHVPVLPNSLYDWAADALPVGPLSSWPSMTGTGSITADAGIPSVVESAGGRFVKFDGEDDRMRFRYNQNSPQTFVAVYRFVNPQLGDSVVYGYNSASTGSISTGTDIFTISSFGNGKWIVPNPPILPDTKWHVALLTIDGANTVLRHDSREVAGTLPTGTRDGLALGYSTKPGNASAIEYKRVVNYPFALNASSRDQLVNQLAARYGIAI